MHPHARGRGGPGRLLPLSAYTASAADAPLRQASDTALTPPTLTAAVADDVIEVRWDAVPGAVRYEMMVWWDPLSDWQPIGGDNLTATSFTHTGLTAGREYFYTIRAVNAEGQKSAWQQEFASATVSANTPTPTPTLTPTPTPTALSPEIAAAQQAPTSTPTFTLTPTPTVPSQVSVSNLDETGTNANTIWCSARADWRCAQGFTTGSAASGGYTLTSITAKFKNKTEPNAGALGDLVVTLHAEDPNNTGRPASATLATLSGSKAPDTAGDYTCAGSGCALTASATYIVQFTASGGSNFDSNWYELASTYSNSETLLPAGNGWTLGDTMQRHKNSWSSKDFVGMIKVVAAEK